MYPKAMFDLCCGMDAEGGGQIQPRQFMLAYGDLETGEEMQYLLTLPEAPKCDERYPLLVYLHSAASADFAKGDFNDLRSQLVLGESPISQMVESGKTEPSSELVAKIISVALCCPTMV